MTQTITEPEAIDIPIELIDTKSCTAQYPWCGGECNDQVEVEPGDEEWQEDAYHCGAVAQLPMLRFTAGGWKDLNDATLLVRHDENEGDTSQPLILIDYPYRECGPAMTAEQARRNAAALLNAADLLDPIPAGVLVIAASAVRIGDSILTDDGWQNVVGQMVFAETGDSEAQVNVWTDNYDHDPDTDGWKFDPADPVKVRRPMHGGDAVLNSTQRPIMSAVGRCTRCATDRVITGVRLVSARGVIRVRGRCQTCGKAGQKAFAGLTSWAEDNQ